MRKEDVPVAEVLCSDTGKPMPKIPLWMAGIKVNFVSDEARQRSTATVGYTGPAAAVLDDEATDTALADLAADGAEGDEDGVEGVEGDEFEAGAEELDAASAAALGDLDDDALDADEPADTEAAADEDDIVAVPPAARGRRKKADTA